MFRDHPVLLVRDALELTGHEVDDLTQPQVVAAVRRAGVLRPAEAKRHRGCVAVWRDPDNQPMSQSGDLTRRRLA
jgi:hypothetical protein